MTWQISIPHRSRDEKLIDVASHARHLGQDEDRQVCRQLVIQAQLDGVGTTAGELLDHLEGLEPTARRALLDRARAECGLKSTAEVDAQRRTNAPLTLRPAPLSPTTELRRRPDGTFFEVSVDPSRWGIGESGQPVLLNAAETDAARQAAAEDSIRNQRRVRAEERAPDAVAYPNTSGPSASSSSANYPST